MRKLAGLLVLLVASVAWSQQVSDADFIVRTTTSGILYLPNGSEIAIPANSQIDLCPGPEDWPIYYHLDADVFDLGPQCPRRPSIFSNGFE